MVGPRQSAPRQPWSAAHARMRRRLSLRELRRGLRVCRGRRLGGGRSGRRRRGRVLRRLRRLGPGSRSRTGRGGLRPGRPGRLRLRLLLPRLGLRRGSAPVVLRRRGRPVPVLGTVVPRPTGLRRTVLFVTRPALPGATAAATRHRRTDVRRLTAPPLRGVRRPGPARIVVVITDAHTSGTRRDGQGRGGQTDGYVHGAHGQPPPGRGQAVPLPNSRRPQEDTPPEGQFSTVVFQQP